MNVKWLPEASPGVAERLLERSSAPVTLRSRHLPHPRHAAKLKFGSLRPPRDTFWGATISLS